MRLKLRTAAALALVAACSMAGCGPERATVSLPPEPAAPEVVLETYLRALVIGDCDSAAALATADLVAQGGVWCARPRVISSKPFGPPAGIPGSELVFAVEIATIGGDVSLPDGAHTWFYDLKKQVNGTWRVASSGSGP